MKNASQKVKTDEILTARALTDAHPKDLSSMALGTRYTFLYSVGIGVDGWIDGITFPSGLSKLTT